MNFIDTLIEMGSRAHFKKQKEEDMTEFTGPRRIPKIQKVPKKLAKRAIYKKITDIRFELEVLRELITELRDELEDDGVKIQ